MDIFSLGVILFIMVFNSFPFQSFESNDPYFKAFVSNKQLFWQSFQKIRKISKELMDLLEKMLCEDPAKRLGFTEILGHKWLQKGNKLKEVQSNVQSQLTRQ